MVLNCCRVRNVLLCLVVWILNGQVTLVGFILYDAALISDFSFKQ